MPCVIPVWNRVPEILLESLIANVEENKAPPYAAELRFPESLSSGPVSGIIGIKSSATSGREGIQWIFFQTNLCSLPLRRFNSHLTASEEGSPIFSPFSSFPL